MGFLLVQRGEEVARLIALLALLGWFWLLLEPWVRRRIERRRQRVGNFVVNFISQSLQQELLFFSLPLLIGSTQLDVGQIAFTGLVGVAAVVSTIDPVYERVIATQAARRMSFHAFCSWIAALVVLPMVLLVPVEQALPISLLAVGAWLLLTLPLSLVLAAAPAHEDRVDSRHDRRADPVLGAARASAGRGPRRHGRACDADDRRADAGRARFGGCGRKTSRRASSRSPRFARRRACRSRSCSNGATTASASKFPSRFTAGRRTAFGPTRASTYFRRIPWGYGPSTS